MELKARITKASFFRMPYKVARARNGTRMSTVPIIKSIKDYFIFGSPLVIIIGFASMYVYYQYFGVPIQDYLQLSEIVTSFLDDSILGAAIAALAVLLTYFNFCRERMTTQYYVHETNVKLTKGERIFRYFRWIVPISLLIYGVAHYIVLPSIDLWNQRYYMEAFFTYAICFLVWLCSLVYDIQTYRRTRSNEHAFNIFAVSFLIFLILINFLQIRSVKYHHGTIGTEVKYSAKGNYIHFVSDSNKYFIGNTQNYVFIFDSRTSGTQIIPMKNVDEIILKIRSINPLLKERQIH